jgi:hypothetical protein
MPRKLSKAINPADVAVFCSYSELRDPASLVPNPRNPNTHSPAQVEVIIARWEKLTGKKAVKVDG